MTDQPETPAYRPRPCPECARMSLRAYDPFCSARCKDIDLNRWLSGRYRIPVRDDEEPAEDNEPPAPKH